MTQEPNPQARPIDVGDRVDRLSLDPKAFQAGSEYMKSVIRFGKWWSENKWQYWPPFTKPVSFTQENLMSEQSTIDALAAALIAERVASHKIVAPNSIFTGATLAKIIAFLRSEGITWTKILGLIGPILDVLMNGGSWASVLAAIVAMFGITVPTTPLPAA